MSLILERPELVRQFLKSHRNWERALASGIQTVLEHQATEVAARVHRERVMPQVYEVFENDKEHKRLIQAARRHCYSAAEDGARAELRRRNQRRGGKSLGRLFKLNPAVEDAINFELRQSFASAAWRGVTETTAGFIRNRLQRGIINGESTEQVAAGLHQTLTGMSRSRSKAIARTEITGSLNSGHHAARKPLADAGILAGHTWLAAGDNDVRDAHEALDGVTVSAKADFMVGGHPAPYPGHFSLPPEQRVNCRCTTVSVTDLEDDELDGFDVD